MKEVRCMNFSHCQHPSKYISLLLPFSMCSSSASRIYTKHCLHWVLNDKALFRKTSFSLTMCLLNCLPSKMCKNKRLTTVYHSNSPLSIKNLFLHQSMLKMFSWKSQHRKHKIGMATHSAEETAVLCEATDVGRVLPFRSCTVILF